MVTLMNKLQKIGRFCFDIVYPNRCPCCNEFLVWNEYLCDKCRKKVLIDISELCRKCGKHKKECICASLLKYDEAAAIAYYEEEARSGLLVMKDSRNKNFGIFAGERLGQYVKENSSWQSCDGIVPVPMDRRSRFLRGYNQAEVIASEMSFVTGIPVMNNCLIKIHGYRVQHTLNADDRKRNTESFQPMGRDLEGMRIILCDDILTTGNTLSRCAEILKMCGAKTVYAAVAATVRRKREE